MLRQRALQAILWTLTGFGIFWLPYRVPAPMSGVCSLSADVGFNNHAAVLAAGIGLLLLTALQLVTNRSARPTTVPSEDMHRGLGRMFVALALLQGTIAIYFFWLLRHQWYLGEGNQFINRLYYVQEHLLPYRDFQFTYGPPFLYIPYAFHLLFGMSMRSAYFVALYLFQFAGLFFLFSLLRHAKPFSLAARWILLILGLPYILGVSLGLQYTAVRFLAPYAALLVCDRILGSAAPGFVRLTLITAASIFAMFLISPEMGLSFIPALLIYFWFKTSHSFGQIAGVLCGLGLATTIVMTALREQVDLVGGYSSGGGSYPLLASPFLLVYLYSVLRLIPRSAAALLSRTPPAMPFPTALMAGFVVQAAALIPGALSRPQIWDVYGYGTGVLLLLMLSLRRNTLASRMYLAAAAFTFVILFPVASFFQYRPLIGLVRASARHSRGTDPAIADSSGLAAFHSLCVPYGESPLLKLLTGSGKLSPDYFDGRINLLTPRQVKRKIADISRCPYIITTPGMFNIQDERDPRLAAMTQNWVKLTFMYPFDVDLKIDSCGRMLLPLSQYIRTHYCETRQLSGGYSVYRMCAAAARN